ncbi:MAG: class IV adenylate cyclase [Clostridia bacterium]|nr:class IV adenylate cyclase [Clostridia bacterium]
MIEVEVKIKVNDKAEIIEALKKQGFTKGKTLRESDTYFKAEFHDFIAIGDALRIRRTENLDTGEKEDMITYKGPRLDTRTKTREELETGVEDSDLMEKVFTNLGFEKVNPVVKVREYYHLDNLTACVDRVEGLGSFLELEIIVSENDGMEAATTKISAMLEKLGHNMDETIKTSYLGLIQLKNGAM